MYKVFGMSGCDEVREILVASARGEKVSASGERFLREHAESCPQCRTRVENERRLSAGLAALACASNGLPSPALGASVMAEFRRQRKVSPMRRLPSYWAAAAAVAAALLLAVWWANERWSEQRQTTARQNRNVPVLTVTEPPVITPVAPPPLHTVRPAARPAPVRAVKARPVRQRAAAPAEERDEVATDFLEIPYTEPLRPHERADVFRVQMPRANMAVFGLPVTGGRLDSNVTADVLMGEDGVVRAIRFVR